VEAGHDGLPACRVHLDKRTRGPTAGASESGQGPACALQQMGSPNKPLVIGSHSCSGILAPGQGGLATRALQCVTGCDCDWLRRASAELAAVSTIRVTAAMMSWRMVMLPG
jgi:hypothetical protein